MYYNINKMKNVLIEIWRKHCVNSILWSIKCTYRISILCGGTVIWWKYIKLKVRQSEISLHNIVILISMLKLICKSNYLWKLLMFFKTCKIQKLMVINSASKWASHSNKSSPWIITSERGRKIITFEMTLVICVFLTTMTC